MAIDRDIEFTISDLVPDYHHIKVKERNSLKSAFISKTDSYEYLRILVV